MGFELVVGWDPAEPAPIALCDNPACVTPFMSRAGWAIAALGEPAPGGHPVRAGYPPGEAPGPPPAARAYLACGDACLAAVRERVGGASSAPLPYGAYWQAIGPVAAMGSDAGGAVSRDDAPHPAVAVAEAIVRAHQLRLRERPDGT